MDRTLVSRLHTTDEQAALLQQTLHQHTACFNAVTDEGFHTGCSNGIELHKRTYYDLRAQHPHLPSQLVCAARVKATEAVKSALARLKKGHKTRAPHSRLCPIRYDARSSWVKWETRTCSLATIKGRVHLPFAIPAHAHKYLGSKVCSAELCSRKGRYTLHVVVSLPDPVISPSHDHVLCKRIVEHAAAGSAIVLENLTHIRARALLRKGEGQRHLHSWSFAQFHSFLIYKAQEKGISVVKVDSRHTSQTCSRCGDQARQNRRSQSLRLCRLCGLSEHADLNASRNIAEKHLASLGTSLAGGSPSDGLSSPSSDEGQVPAQRAWGL
ncbi:RNA-guided endonuclease InsQ/TnpB family protein [Ktedonospora formicarum]|uniref:Cas12f1-like TNB domain-containing protein n=1 Tax=Ktedonospora formicarum TaxID=2778364 RepID=A0A8J3I7U3_9CHLR|nr:zinc ribbon domain-containing protein [Ktedonospora formicarum]GHO47647.1 hypothetical protein KSX_58100 [Ktedonospora formicarum]